MQRVSGLNPYFKQIGEIAEKKPYAISSRIYFMVQDVIDLRKRKWVPRVIVDSGKMDDELDTVFEEDESDAKVEDSLSQRSPDEEKKDSSKVDGVK